jgi:hypothetical protein
MRCSNLTMPEQTTALNHIIVPKDRVQLLAGPEFKALKPYERCPGE